MIVASLLAAAAPASPAASPSWSPSHRAAAPVSVPAAANGVIRVPLPPPGRRLPLPAITGPADSRRPLVVIDPGHGGADRGSSAGDDREEKTLALALARAVRDELVGRGHTRVALTRDADRLLTLEERAGIAARLGADLFLSLHLGPATSRADGGLRVYTYGDEPSAAPAAQRAVAENDADRSRGRLLGASSARIERQPGPLTPRQVRERSTVFANLVVRESGGRLRMSADPRGQAPFAVLAGIAAPAVLIDAGSLGETQALASPAGRAGFARALADAIGIYFARLPPER
jgi:N-acetylmuramoyl-L-alanine amidase